MKQLSPTEAKRETDWAEVENEDEMHHRTPERDGVLLRRYSIAVYMYRMQRPTKSAELDTPENTELHSNHACSS